MTVVTQLLFCFSLSLSRLGCLDCRTIGLVFRHFICLFSSFAPCLGLGLGVSFGVYVLVVGGRKIWLNNLGHMPLVDSQEIQQKKENHFGPDLCPALWSFAVEILPMLCSRSDLPFPRIYFAHGFTRIAEYLLKLSDKVVCRRRLVSFGF